ncbi:hypothetical protein AVEN_61097-1 [Araneus ventricosus]|uniref:Uncharacterized protein n=1 Tax=Araneus ventricosus TaxID=182803 RepID=A0A4Y2JS59_ARAVE|nr:hypothetical protein AVEN_253358-1 [Araneus ventricosus]GBM92870.1 hypothetical protein AVEN_61097-1 [Araneus ventricosus]
MASVPDNSRIFKPHLPTPLHVSTVKVAVVLCKDFGLATLKCAYENIQAGIEIEVVGNNEFPSLTACKRAQDRLLSIPLRLRNRLMEAVHC